MGSGMKKNKVGKRGAEHVGPKKRKVEWSKEGKRRECRDSAVRRNNGTEEG